MAGGLPEGLISNKKDVTVGIEDAVGLEAADTLKLWRSMLPGPSFSLAGQLMSSLVFSSGNAAIAENVGRRLENFFWRIAMSERVRERLSGAHIEKQFDGIRQGGYIRTTPTPSPRSSRSLDIRDMEVPSNTSTGSAVPSSPASPEAGPVDDDEELQATSVTPTPPSHLRTISEATTKPKGNRRTKTTRPPPILKNFGSSSNQSSKSASILSPASQGSWSAAGAASEQAVTFDDEPTPTESLAPVAGKSARKSTTTRFSEEVAVSIPKVSTASQLFSGRPIGESNQRAGRRNPIVVASTGASKRRPLVMRQRSSHISSFGASKDAPSRSSSSPNLARSVKPTYTSTAKTSNQEAGAVSARRLPAASPHPFKPREGSSPSPPPSDETTEGFGGEGARAQETSTNTIPRNTPVEETANANFEESKPLVDPDFRSKFMDRTRPPIRSPPNISSFARKSNAAVPTAASFQASGVLDTGQVISTTGRSRGKGAFQNEIVPLKAPASAGPELPAETPEPLPRTKSQLTLLLEREKNRSAG